MKGVSLLFVCTGNITNNVYIGKEAAKLVLHFLQYAVTTVFLKIPAAAPFVFCQAFASTGAVPSDLRPGGWN